MGSHSNFNKEKCWSCAFFVGNRKVSTFLVKSVMTDSMGTCTCKGCPDCGKKVQEDHWCRKWQIDSITSNLKAEAESKKAIEQQRREADRLAQEEERQRMAQQKELDRQRRVIERERLKLEHDKWYASLSPEERAAEDARVAEKERVEQARMEEWCASQEKEADDQALSKVTPTRIEDSGKAKHKKAMIIADAICGGLLVFELLFLLFLNATKNAMAAYAVAEIKLTAEEEAELENASSFYTGLCVAYPLVLGAIFGVFALVTKPRKDK